LTCIMVLSHNQTRGGLGGAWAWLGLGGLAGYFAIFIFGHLLVATHFRLNALRVRER